MCWVKKSWNGEERLWKVFWLYFFLFGAIYGVLTFIIGQFYCLPFIPVVFVLMLSLWSMVSIWRCAFNSRNRVWAYLARIWVCFLIFIYILVTCILFLGRNYFIELKCEMYKKEYIKDVRADIDLSKYNDNSEFQECIKRNIYFDGKPQ